MKEGSTGTLFWDPFGRKIWRRRRQIFNRDFAAKQQNWRRRRQFSVTILLRSSKLAVLLKPSYDLGRAGATHALRVLSSTWDHNGPSAKSQKIFSIKSKFFVFAYFLNLRTGKCLNCKIYIGFVERNPIQSPVHPLQEGRTHLQKPAPPAGSLSQLCELPQ